MSMIENASEFRPDSRADASAGKVRNMTNAVTNRKLITGVVTLVPIELFRVKHDPRSCGSVIKEVYRCFMNIP